ncbi:DUF309 domain-containing protein [Cohnella rhizosphaerae]|uniref:DUF309 domain-containing protein n=1 Tax=Cohnella rhizosphaerae TaxID=1457232 RepID=A0A9X4KYC2_9BACL|nr:DUF309 domain-containing protein [Cohnella rhizosphaerae]MDG0813018.1 DUF309 domain-containing protein [Cohnella rhizosphaerae]
MMSLFPIPDAFVHYLAEYHGTRDYFECHEIMEEYWKQKKEAAYEGSWLVLIRIAVMQYHARRGNGSGALKLLAKADSELDTERMDELGLDGRQLKRMLGLRKARWADASGVAYDDFNLPIVDRDLLDAAVRKSEALGAAWLSPGDRAEERVVHRHLARDRTDVVQAREAAIRSRQRDRTLGNAD